MKHRTVLVLPADLVRRAKAAAALEGTTLTELVREALEARLKQRKEVNK